MINIFCTIQQLSRRYDSIAILTHSLFFLFGDHKFGMRCFKNSIAKKKIWLNTLGTPAILLWRRISVNGYLWIQYSIVWRRLLTKWKVGWNLISNVLNFEYKISSMLMHRKTKLVELFYYHYQTRTICSSHTGAS